MKIYGVLFAALIVAIILFVVNGDDINKYDADEALKTAITNSDAGELQNAIDFDANTNRVYYNGLTPLLFASAKGNVQIVEILLDNGADIHGANHYKQTALTIALMFGNNKVAELLLERGADPSVIDIDGITPMEYARHKRNAEGMELLKQHLK